MEREGFSEGPYWYLRRFWVCWHLRERLARPPKTTIVASGALPKRTTSSTKPRNITVGKADKPSTRGTNCAKRGNAAGTSGTVGGTKMVAVGTAIATGMTTITIAAAHKSRRSLWGAPTQSGRPFFEGEKN